MNPGETIGRTPASGSSSATKASIALHSGVASGERVPPTDSTHSRSYESSPSAAASAGSTSAGVSPGKQAAVADDLAEARDHVREPRRGDHRRRDGRAEHRLHHLAHVERKRGDGPVELVGTGDVAEQREERLGLGDEAAAAAGTRRRARSAERRCTSALSPMPGMDPWPLRPCTFNRNGELIFSAVVQR